MTLVTIFLSPGMARLTSIISSRSIAVRTKTAGTVVVKADFDVVTHAGEHVRVGVVGVLDGHLRQIYDLQFQICDLSQIASFSPPGP